ncbi:hypothetical protein GUITHDRAFT_107940 [Guillardia theta CCMP2712]|uniref:Uncharacterized protein n=1 Tax=Guillardia theta (strain CCMP2712) TaxID=905079 RepID=L1JDY7_GUITC|nr:hypothetical protein GUITHDRAFT_107940 [Guillardia theta CCMP2712]EKX46334.1 hypothetical protein GUITHDRAFT_107940 [Guillardia theta CCMP2712]|eukprot:XP_005833314.1 hypothetical protein GUITHDRAFT_107940 [Guillardia theta CCMP2712]
MTPLIYVCASNIGLFESADAGNQKSVLDLRTKEPFPLQDYSSMKHGDSECTRRFAVMAAKAILREVPEVAFADSPPRFVVCFRGLPIASTYLSSYTVEEINKARRGKGVTGDADLLVVDRSSANFGKDYATRSLTEREATHKAMTYTVAEEAVFQRNLIFLDDVRITGATDRAIERMLLPMRPKCLVIAHIAVFDQDQALSNPAVESMLNSSVINGVEDIATLVESGRFDLGGRALRMVLQDPEALTACLSRFPLVWLRRFIAAADLIGEEFTEQFREGLQVLRAAIKRREGHYEASQTGAFQPSAAIMLGRTNLQGQSVLQGTVCTEI